MMQQKGIQTISHFYNFNALRFVAAFLVVLHHAESLRKDHGLFHLKDFGLFQNGANAVTFFFVLSGFLITYLLLKEQGKTATISIKHFYLKRVLRIWPLYFLLVIIGVFIQPLLVEWMHLSYKLPYSFSETWYFFVFFLPGMVTFYFGNHLLEPLWSIGVEELFYLIWAPIFKFLKRIIFPVMLGIIGLKMILLVAASHGWFNEETRYLIRILQFESMALGGLAAYVIYYFGNHSFFQSKSRKAFLFVMALLALAIVFVHTKTFDDALFATIIKSLVFALFLLLMGVKNQATKVGEHKWLVYFGEISYGIYMYHLVVLTGLVELMKVLKIHPIVDTAIYFVLATGITIGVAALSKATFENYFLKFKPKS